MYLTIDKEWWDKNAEHFLKRHKEEYSDEKAGYLIETKDDKLFTEYDEESWTDSENGYPIISWSNQGIYFSAKCTIKEEMFKDLLSSIPSLIPVAIEVITKKFNQVKSLLETAKAL